MNKDALSTFWTNVEYYRIALKMYKKDVYVIERFGKNMTILNAAKIATELYRTHGGVKRRIGDLGIKLRPIYRDNHKKYSQEEIDCIVSMYQAGHSFQTIAEKFDRSEAGIRGKLERIGFSFNNRVLSKKDKEEEK